MCLNKSDILMLSKVLAFTILESMLGLLLSSLLMSIMVMTFVAFKQCYERVMVISTVQDDGRFAIAILRRNINQSEKISNIFTKNNIPARLHAELKNKSDVLILEKQGRYSAFYLAQASWKQDGRSVSALFEKPLDGQRQELIADVIDLHFKSQLGGIEYDLTVTSMSPVLRFVDKWTDRFLKRSWYGFAAVGVASNA